MSQGAHPTPLAIAPVETVPVESPATRPTIAGSVMVLGDVKSPGQRDLTAGQKVSDVLKCCELSTPATKMTLVLNRRCPEGTSREMIDLDQNLKLVDATRDYVLRDGDELVVSVVPSVPAGLSRPMTAEMPH
jgi:protein involved in polysaccharide export with SLBB domain